VDKSRARVAVTCNMAAQDSLPRICRLELVVRSPAEGTAKVSILYGYAISQINPRRLIVILMAQVKTETKHSFSLNRHVVCLGSAGLARWIYKDRSYKDTAYAGRNMVPISYS